MNNEPHFSSSNLEERTDLLFREIELAARWERPAILFAIYRSESIRDQVMAELKQKLTGIGQKIHLLELSNKDQIDSLQESANLPDLSSTNIFLDGSRQGDNQNSSQNFELINKYREYFIIASAISAIRFAFSGYCVIGKLFKRFKSKI